MSTPSPVPDRSRPRISSRVTLQLLAITLVCAVCLMHLPPAQAQAPGAAGEPTPAEITRFRIASFNILGHGHTEPGGKKARWASGPKRMNWTVRLMQENKLDVVGMQELQPKQLDRFQQLAGRQWTVYPARRLSTSAMHNSIVFRKSKWRMLDARTVAIPYFRGNRLQMPYVWLEHRKTGRRVWVLNTHNPANSRGPAQRWRNLGYRIEANLINRLRADYPNSAVFSTGDKNDRGDYLCRLSRWTAQHASNGGGLINGRCTTPRPSYVDWVMGSSDTWFTNAKALRSSLVRRASDHPLIMATANLSPAKAMPVIDRTVVVAVQGLTRQSIRRLGAAGAPNLTQMRRSGVSTLDARASREATDGRSNLVGLLTGRRVRRQSAGHGVTPRTTASATVSGNAGRYVSSIFDLAHNFSLRTEMLTSDRASVMVQSSWNASTGGADPYGRDNGRNKIDRFRLHANDAATVDDLVRSLRNRPAALSVTEMTRPARAGRRAGFNSQSHLAAVRRVDADLGRVRAQIARDPRLAGSTVLVVVGLHGGSGRSHDDPTRPNNYRVPMLVTGPGVPAGTDLYAANPTLAHPNRSRPKYAARQPAWVMSVPVVVNQALGLPPLPGAQVAYRVPTSVFSSFR